ncbi:MAG: hypothetical protein J0M20_07835 [Burkholderiales bacterium]|nr:hypothetical protein [Burkholderiales bacterium]
MSEAVRVLPPLPWHGGALLCLGLWAGALTAQAAPPSWTLVRREAGMAYHLDTSALRMQGPYLSYWILVRFRYDPRFDGALPYRSARILRYADCASRRQDTKSVLQYHTPMGQGQPIWEQSFDDATLRLEPVEPGSLSARLLDRACALWR